MLQTFNAISGQFNLTSRKDRSVLSLEDYGISKGSTPSFSDFQTAWNTIQTDAIAQGINRIYIPECQVTTTSRLDINVGYSGIIQFDTNAKITRNHSGECFRQQGTIVTTTAEAITSDINSTSNAQFSINTPSELQQARLATGGVSRLGVVVNDWIAIIGDNKFTGIKSPNDGMFGNLRRVRTISGDNITIQPLYRNFSVAQNARVLKLNLIKGAKITGGNFTDSATIQAATFIEPFIRFSLAESPSITELYIHDLGGKAIEFTWCYAAKACDNEIRNLPDNETGGQFGYGVSTAGGCLQPVIQRNKISQTRHGYTTDRCFLSGLLRLYGETESALIDSNYIFDNYNTSIDTHEEGWGIVISNNIINGGENGIYIRSKSCIVSNNQIIGATSYGVYVSDYGYDTIITGNRILRTIRDQTRGFGGYNIQALPRCQIIGNFLGNAIGDILVGSTANVDGVGDTNIRIVGNNLQSNTGIVIQNSCTNTFVALNTGTGSNTFIQEDSGSTGTRLINNINFGTGTYSLSGTNRVQLGNTGLPDTGLVQAIKTVTSSTALTSVDSSIICNPTGAITLTLPAASASLGRIFIIKNISSQTITITPSGADTTELTSISANSRAWLQNDGSRWHQIV